MESELPEAGEREIGLLINEHKVSGKMNTL